MAQSNRPLYLDYMATTPVDPRVIHAIQDCLGLKGTFGNPASASHQYGWQARAAVETARAEVATLIGADSDEIIWTSGATESINLALKGVARFYQNQAKHLITLTTEHKAVLDTCHYLSQQGFEITYLSPQSNGLIDLDTLNQAIRPDTLCVSVMHVNNEIGVIQPLSAIANLIKPRGILFHVDAAQSAGKIPIDVKLMQIDLLAISAHKLYGPKGIGALYVRKNPQLHLEPLIHGGGHERGLRSGTLPTHQIVGMGTACRLAQEMMSTEHTRLHTLKHLFLERIQTLPGLHIHGDLTERIPGNLNLSFEHIHGDALLLALKNLAISTRSACTSLNSTPSHVLRALNVPDDLAQSAIRISWGRFTTEKDIAKAAQSICTAVTRLRKMSPFWRGFGEES